MVHSRLSSTFTARAGKVFLLYPLLVGYPIKKTSITSPAKTQTRYSIERAQCKKLRKKSQTTNPMRDEDSSKDTQK